MDGSRFDDLTRTLATGVSRRGALKFFLGAVAAGLTAGVARDATAQSESDSAAARRGPYWRAGKRCNSSDRCGAKVPCVNGQCTPDHCYINEEEVAVGTTNPDNTCQWCLPVVLWNGWGGTTGDGEACTVADPEPCYSDTGQCLNNDCVPDPLPDGDLCGIGQTCCGGVCCTATQCCNSDHVCEECGPHCTIDRVPVPANAPEPGGTCRFCDPAADPFFWSTAPDDMSCGPNRLDVCCSGICCSSGKCCGADGNCTIECGPTCNIDGVDYADGALNEDVPCQVCDPSRSTSAWSAATTNFPCGANGDQVCCDGVCCNAGECCGPSACSDTCDHCFIDGVLYPDGAHNPENLCEYCQVGMGPVVTAWTVNSDNDLCGPNNDRICCNGVCLRPGLCCNADGNRVSGECNPEGCTIDGIEYAEGDHPSPDNTCAVCTTADPENWTLLPDDAPCGDTQNQVCCGGACCGPDECCNPDGTCGACGCTIEEIVHADGAPNPNNPCEVCDPALNPTAWSPSDAQFCGEAGDRACCNGACCSPGECCNLTTGQCGTCTPGCTIDGTFYADGTRNPTEFCEVCNAAYPTQWSPRVNPDCPPPCTIDGALVAYGTTNPANPCEQCDGGLSPTSWSPSDALFCDEAGDRACCNGACCNPGECCKADGICGTDSCVPEGCTIDGAQYANGTVNPDNACQVCDETASKTTWSPNGFGSCGPNQDQFCANGVCCALGICPDLGAGGCGDYCDAVCVIGGTLYHDGDRNPANGCEVCASHADHTAWSLVAPNFFCDPEARAEVCCNGTCCSPGFGCSPEGGCIALAS